MNINPLRKKVGILHIKSMFAVNSFPIDDHSTRLTRE